MLARTTIHIISFILHSAVLHYSTAAQVNFSLIINLYSLTPFFTAVAFWIFFNEKLKKTHIIGMLLIFSCVYVTSQAEGNAKSNHNKAAQGSPTVSVAVPITLAIVSTLCFTTSNSLGRFFISRSKGSLKSQ